jgi:hypothetical protein
VGKQCTSPSPDDSSSGGGGLAPQPAERPRSIVRTVGGYTSSGSSAHLERFLRSPRAVPCLTSSGSLPHLEWSAIIVRTPGGYTASELFDRWVALALRGRNWSFVKVAHVATASRLHRERSGTGHQQWLRRGHEHRGPSPHPPRLRIPSSGGRTRTSDARVQPDQFQAASRTTSDIGG